MSFDVPNELGKKYPDTISGFAHSGNQVTFTCATVQLKLTFLSPTMVRFRYTHFEEYQDFSYAISPTFKTSAAPLKIKEEEAAIHIRTSALHIIASKKNLSIRIEDLKGNLISEDEAGYHWEENLEHGGHYVYHTRFIQKDERFFGLGDKTCEANLREKKFAVWATDTYGFEKDQDPIYRAIPFFIGFHHGLAYGIFFDNTFKSYFDFGFEVKEMASFWADGGEMNFYFIYGPELIKVTEQYTLLTGTPELPPLWALGYHQCKWSYRPESQVREIANEFRTRKIPCDAIYLDIDYMDGFRCFTWNNDHFPNPAKMVSDLEKDGFKTVVIIDPGIKIDKEYTVYTDGLERDVFCKRADGYHMKGAVWPGYCYFPDFTKPDTREWWGEQFKGLIGDGIRGIWNDMNEPAVFGFGTMPQDVRHDYDGQIGSHRKAHNVYGMQMARATYEGIKKLLHPHRPFNITRSGFSGFQRFASVWTGDNIATWEHLWLANVQCQRLNISGVSFCGTDIGGFIGEPNGELFTRWIQLAVFHPFFRGHSSGDRGEKEPWVFGKELELIAKKFIELRYKLLPFIYTTFWQYVTHGTPMIRPLCFIGQDDVETYHRMDEVGFGDHMLICPLTGPGQDGRWMYLPKGSWYNYWTNSFYLGGLEFFAEAKLDSMPIFVRAGAILPQYPVMQHTGEKKIEELELLAYYNDETYTSTIYEDAGDGYGYAKGDFNQKTFVSSGTSKAYQIKQSIAGEFKTDYEFYIIRLIGLPFNPKEAVCDGKKVTIKNNAIKVPVGFGEITVK